MTVSDSRGKLAFQGKTNSAGAFATESLAPGDYVVQFNGDAQGSYALVVAAGRTKVSADSVDGDKISKGGVAMRVKVAAGNNITGQVINEAFASTGDVKIINGRKWVWVASSTGSHLGGRWMEEGTAQPLNLVTLDSAGVQNWQDRGMLPHGGR